MQTFDYRMAYIFFPPCPAPTRMMIASDNPFYLPHPYKIFLVWCALAWTAAESAAPHSSLDHNYCSDHKVPMGLQYRPEAGPVFPHSGTKLWATNPICWLWVAIEITGCVRWAASRLKGRSSAAAWGKWELSVLWQEDKRKAVEDRYTGPLIS